MDLASLKIILKKINIKKLKKSKIKNILISGCSGFIGNYLLNTLLSDEVKNNFKIYGLDIIKPKIFYFNNKNNLYFYKKNLFKLKSFRLNKKIDLVIHLAGIPSPSFYKLKPVETFYLNSEVCKIFLEFAKKKKFKIFLFNYN